MGQPGLGGTLALVGPRDHCGQQPGGCGKGLSSWDFSIGPRHAGNPTPGGLGGLAGRHCPPCVRFPWIRVAVPLCCDRACRDTFITQHQGERGSSGVLITGRCLRQNAEFFFKKKKISRGKLPYPRWTSVPALKTWAARGTTPPPQWTPGHMQVCVCVLACRCLN